MAESQKSSFSCSTCGQEFQYKSKYKRHLLSNSHLRFSRSLGISLTHQIEEVKGELESDARPGWEDESVLEDEAEWDESFQLRSVASSPFQQTPASSSMTSNANFACSEDNMSLFWAAREFNLISKKYT